ncbi:MAG: hypothetical protein KDK36_20990 [Leptospiraceae bacterium]|nr:hypothetical protein [Leptospiraceae bacterium]
MNIKKIIFGIIAFFLSSFVIQGILGMVIGGDYFMKMPIMRKEPNPMMGMGATLIMGVAFSILYSVSELNGTNLQKGLKFGILVGLLLVPFLALDIPGRFDIPDTSKWIIIQSSLGFLHFIISGIAVAFIYNKDS